jgi:hypothetical protein
MVQIALLLALACVPLLSAHAEMRSLTLMPGQIFGADSYVHKPLPDDAPLEPNSDKFVNVLLSQIKRYYGHADIAIDSYSSPIYIVPSTQPTVEVKAVIWDDPMKTFPALRELQKQWLAVPLPDDSEPSAGTDSSAMVVQPSTGRVWEFWLTRKTGAQVQNSEGSMAPQWGARWGGRLDSISSNPGYFITTPEGYKFGTAASGIPMLAGTLTIEELQRGVIDHIVGVGIPEVLADRWSFPAQRSDGESRYEFAIPEGAIFRLPANLDLDAIEMEPLARMIAKAVQKHGMIVTDRSGVVGFAGQNPLNRYPEGSPYWGKGGIMRCPEGRYTWACSGPMQLVGFPWDKLQLLKLDLRSH